jgi:hypothetical protein
MHVLFARLNADGSLDNSFVPSLEIHHPIVIARQPDGKVLAGGPSTIIRLYADGGRDSTFNPGTGAGAGTIHSIALQTDGHSDGSLDAGFPAAFNRNQDVRSISSLPDGKLFVGGGNMTFHGVFRQSAARLYGDSSPPVSFAARAAGYGLSGLTFSSLEQTRRVLLRA